MSTMPEVERLTALTRQLADGGTVTAEHAAELAAAVVQLAGPDSFLAGEGRVPADDKRLQLAQAVLARAETTPQLDEYAEEILEGARAARTVGLIRGTWPIREQLAVALVLADHRFLARAGFTAATAAAYVADGMVPPPSDMQAWVGRVRDALAKETQQ